MRDRHGEVVSIASDIYINIQLSVNRKVKPWVRPSINWLMCDCSMVRFTLEGFGGSQKANPLQIILQKPVNWFGCGDIYGMTPVSSTIFVVYHSVIVSSN